MPAVDVIDIYHRLVSEYGTPPRLVGEKLDPISELIFTILSQNTSDRNRDRAFYSLCSHYKNWDALLKDGINEIAHIIRAGGLGLIKAKRMQSALQEILRQRGTLDLSFLRQLSINEAKQWLIRLPGIGPKTAACILLFSLDMPAFPVDTHIYRLSQRLGLIQNGVSLKMAHIVLQNMIPDDKIYPMHILMIEHGRKVCHWRSPVCNLCVLESLCLSSQSDK